MSLYSGIFSAIKNEISGSMEPSYYRGDILFLMRKETIEPGDIVVYSLESEAIPIVHRAITV